MPVIRTLKVGALAYVRLAIVVALGVPKPTNKSGLYVAVTVVLGSMLVTLAALTEDISTF